MREHGQWHVSRYALATDVLYGVLKLPFTDASTALVPLLQAVCFLRQHRVAH